MNKHGAREWVSTLEKIIDTKLRKWTKGNKIENGEAVQLRWQFEQTHIILDVFWEDHKEALHLAYLNPRSSHRFEWHGLSDNSLNKVMDRIGNMAQVTMYPLKDG